MIPKKILIVEDDDALRKVLTDKLGHENFDVVEAKDGQSGLEAARHEKPDFILLDIMMPVMDGFEMATKWREEEKQNKVPPPDQIPITFLTNLGDEAKLAEAQKKGFYNYLIKSNWKIEDVVKHIKDRLKITT